MVPPPPPLTVPPHAPVITQNPVLVVATRLLIDKIQKFRAEEFRGKVDVDPAKAEYWLVSTRRVFKELMCIPEDYLRCAMSLLKE